MTLQCVAAVWDRSEQKGQALLLLLAIADYLNDQGAGVAPAVSALAQKTRMTPNGVLAALEKLQRSGELVVHDSAGPGGTDLYRLNLPDPPLTTAVSKPAQKRSETKLSAQCKEIYESYPRKAARGAALKAIEKALTKIGYPELLAAVQEFAESPLGQHRNFCPYPASWMNQERWNDDRNEWQRKDDVDAPPESRIPTDDDLANYTP